MAKIIVREIDPNSGETRKETECDSIGAAVYLAASLNTLDISVGYTECQSVWIQEQAGHFEYRVDTNSERYVESFTNPIESI